MIDKIEIITRHNYSIPYNRFVRYEESDLNWAVPLGYAKLANITKIYIENGVEIFRHVDITGIEYKEDNDWITKEFVNKIITLNPESTYKPI